MIIHKGQIFDNLDNVPRTESRTTTRPGIEQEEGRKRKKEIKTEREREKKTVSSSTQGREGRNAARGPMVSRLGKRKKKRVERNASHG